MRQDPIQRILDLFFMWLYFDNISERSSTWFNVYDLPARVNIHVAMPERRIGMLERNLQIWRTACNKRGVVTDNFRKNDLK